MFNNRVRLPIYLRTPQFPTEANRFRLSNGESKTLSVVVRKVWEILTDYMTKQAHQRLVIALNHDNVSIEGDKYVGGVTVDSDYEIVWPDFLDYPLGQAKVKIQVTPFDVTNSNCQSCEQATQLSVVDDDIGTIEEGATATVNAYDNDSICCYPVTAEIVSYNTGYLDSAEIDPDTGVITLVSKTPNVPATNVVLATYRVTCPDGTYDEADVYGTIEGTEEECPTPSGFLPVVVSDPPAPFSADIEWTVPASDPAFGYEWVLKDMADPGVNVQSGPSTDKTVTLTGLQPNTNYGFYVKSICSAIIFDPLASPFAEFLFSTPESDSDQCGTFDVSVNDETAGNEVYYFSYMDCAGIIQTQGLANLTTRSVCMLMDAFNEPVYFQGHAGVFTYLYTSLC